MKKYPFYFSLLGNNRKQKHFFFQTKTKQGSKSLSFGASGVISHCSSEDFSISPRKSGVAVLYSALSRKSRETSHGHRALSLSCHQCPFSYWEEPSLTLFLLLDIQHSVSQSSSPYLSALFSTFLESAHHTVITAEPLVNTLMRAITKTKLQKI